MHYPQLFARLLLQFDAEAEAVPEDLSGAVRTPDGSLWLASDEGTYLEHLRPVDPRRFGAHRRHTLHGLVGARSPAAEMDLEGLCYDEGHLWMLGSHSAKRKRPKGKPQRALERLATVEHPPERFVLARVALEERAAPAAGGKGQAPPARAGLLGVSGKAGKGEDGLVDLLRRDAHLGPFLAAGPDGGLAIPGKDNGLDIEGLAVRGGRVYLGLRGPVLRGWAVVLELELADVGHGTLAPRRRKGRPLYRKHFLELDGLGVRGLEPLGGDLLVVAGATLPVEAPKRIFRWRGALHLDEDGVHAQEEDVLEPLFDLPPVRRSDHAESLTLHSYFEPDDSLLVVYDTPSPERRWGRSGVLADVFRLP